MQKALNFFKDTPKSNYIAAFGAGLLAFYAYLRRKPEVWTKQNKLKLTLDQLLNDSNPPYLKKIVITETEQCSGDTRDALMQLIKSNLTLNGITVLVNCSPQKVLRSGCQFFVNYVDQRSKKNVQFYQNALKTQLLVQKTIADIDAITRKQQKLPVVMLCDNNSMDVKINANGWRWDDFITQFHVDQQKLKKSYDVIIHIQNDDKNEQQQKSQKKISDCWRDHQRYFTISESSISQQNAKKQALKGLNYIRAYLTPFMGQNYQWKDQGVKIMQQK